MFGLTTSDNPRISGIVLANYNSDSHLKALGERVY